MPRPVSRLVAELRAAGLRAEAYVGTGKFGDQMKYADRRGAAIAVIEGGDERAKGEVTLKDLALGAELAKSVESRAAWVGDAPGADQRASAAIWWREIKKAAEAGALMVAFPYYDAAAIDALNDQAVALLKLFAARGYAREEPSMLQPADIFLDRSGEEIRRRTFTLTDPSGRELCLRPDLTIPDLQPCGGRGAEFPARLCYNGLAFRHQPSGPRPTQFFQAGVELLGLDDRGGGRDRKSCRWRLTPCAPRVSRISSCCSATWRCSGRWWMRWTLPTHWRARLKRHFWRAGYFEALLRRCRTAQPAMRNASGASRDARQTNPAPAFEGLMDLLAGAQQGARTREEIVDRLMEQAADAAALRLDPASPA